MAKPSKLSLKVIDQWLNYISLQNELPGFQVSIRAGADLVFDKGYGFANVATKEKYSTRHLGRIASQSKVFTASLALELVALKMLQLNDSVADFMPELKVKSNSHFSKISIESLLTNRSSLNRDSERTNYWISKIGTFPNALELVDEIANLPLVKKPINEVKYSNLGYALAGHILERVGGKPFHELIEKHLLSKISGVTILTDHNKKSNLANGYIREQIGKRRFIAANHRAANAMAPAAGFCSNTASTTKFFSKLYLEKSLLPKRQTNLLLSTMHPVPNTEDEYGLGTIFTKANGHSYIGHSGGFPGFSSQTWVNPKLNLTVGFCTNVSAVKTLNYIRGICEIIETVDSVFPINQSRTPIVSPPMADNYGSTLYVLGDRKAIGFSLLGFLPNEGTMIFNKLKGRFFCEKLSGYMPNKEPLDFILKSNQIVAVKWGGTTTYPLK